jgi:hypothetical protein
MKIFRLIFLCCLFSPILGGMKISPLRALESGEVFSGPFSDPSRVWGRGAEGVIEEAYRLCFKTRIIGGRVMNLRMPFAQNNERNIISGENWEYLEDGKGDPVLLWRRIEEILGGEDFGKYLAVLEDPREKVIIFDIPGQTWRASRDFFDLARMKAGSYQGFPHRPYVLVSGKKIEESDVYNYLYCVGLAGMDCSGFVWHVLSYLARRGGLDLGRVLGPALGAPRNTDPSRYAGTAFYNSPSSQLTAVDDKVKNLRPADIILFRGPQGEAIHSAVIQSVNLETGLIRYLQSTDEAPLKERGVHESFIRFDPGKPEISLGDSSLVWSQKRCPPFPGEMASPYSDDGERYRAYPEHGAGRVVRLKALVPVIDRLSSGK